MQEKSNKIVNIFLCQKIFEKLGGTLEAKKTSLFILFFTRLALIFDKLGCASEIKMKNFVFHFVFLSACTNF